MQAGNFASVFVIGRFPPPLDGQSISTRRLAELLEGNRQVERVNTSPPDSKFVVAEAKVRIGRIVHYAVLLPSLRRKLRRAPEAPVLWASISPVKLGHWRDMLTVFPAFGPERKVFAVVHRATFEQVFTSPLTSWSGRLLAERLSGFVFLDEQLASACAPWIPDGKRFVIPNTVEAAVLCSEDALREKRRDRAGRSQLRLLFLAGMMPEKGYWDVLEAIKILRQRGVSVQAKFAGGWVHPKDEAAFDQFLSENDLRGLATHIGAVKERGRVKELHLWADVFLLPTYHPTEAQPISLIEAMNAGTPLIVSPQGGVAQMVQSGREGLHVPSRTPSAIADAVEQLVDNETWLGMSLNARARFDATYGPDVVLKQWVALLDSQR